MHMNDMERRVLKSINTDSVLEYLQEIVSIPSYGGRESSAQRNVAAKLRELGLNVDIWDLDFDTLRSHPGFSMSIQREEGLGVVGTLKGTEKDRSLIFNGHIDTVALGKEENWRHPPLEGIVVRDRIYGRGVADMKGGLCCAIYAAKAIIDVGVKLKGDLSIQSVIGEEDGGVGALSTVLRGHIADAAIVMEPTEGKVAPAHSGALAFTVEVSGRSAHACIREEGVSAIEKFIILFKALRDLETRRNKGIDDPLYTRYGIPYPINVGTIQGGNWPGSVPESLVFQGRVGVIVGERVKDARRSVEEAIAAETDPWLKENPPRLDWNGYQFDSANIETNHPIVEKVQRAYSDATGKQAQLEGMTYASDMRHLVNTGGVPTVLFGPGDVRQAHTSDEYVEIEGLVTAARVLALTALRFCGYEEP
ncbi:acetylornithine deacetylase [Candidatus Bathyarchaeota archaeon]|jgi:acetylornithine deacetylase|nr:acetylornithine deacetylase [Candidatus Bathyarchaeota archaeon]